MHHNDILSRLHRSHPDFVTRQARQVSYVHGDIVGEAGAPIEDVLFPSSGMISLVVDLADGDRIEAGMVGRRGMVGSSALFGSRTHLTTAFAQLPGSGWSMRASDLIELADREPGVRELFFRNEQYTLAQAQQTAACNAKHRIPQRLAAWILRAHYDSGEDELLLTQEYLAQMLGVQRASVSMFAGGLQDKGLIFYRRGRVRILDRAGLEAEACECHATLRGRHSRLFEHAAVQRV
jgi:CRP-like cAMP-binding protein